MAGYSVTLADGRIRRVRETTGTEDEGKAQKFLEKRLREAANDRDGIASWEGPDAKRVTCGDLLAEKLADYRARQVKGLDDVEYKLRKGSPLHEWWAQRRACTVGAATFDAFIAERRAAGKRNATINRELEFLRAAFKLGVDRKLVVRMPRFPEKLSEKDGVRQGFFERADLELLLPHLAAPFDDMARFAYLTGWRRGELLGLRWQWVDLDGGEIRLPDSKNGRPRSLPIDEELAQILRRAAEARRFTMGDGTAGLSAFVFHRGGQAINRNTFGAAWRAACKRAGLGHWEKDDRGVERYQGRHFHDFRRTAARNMTRAGVPQTVAMAITGHETDAMFRRYDITDNRDKLAALKAARELTSREREKSNIVAGDFSSR
jgi:integrase